jgi:hypothetical protein
MVKDPIGDEHSLKGQDHVKSVRIVGYEVEIMN